MHDSARVGRAFRPGDWWACEFPERPFNPTETWFAADCRACVLALGASAVALPEQLIGFTIERTQLNLREAYDVCRIGHALPELPVVVP